MSNHEQTTIPKTRDLPLTRKLDFAEAWDSLSSQAKLAVMALVDSGSLPGNTSRHIRRELESRIAPLDNEIARAVKEGGSE